MNEAMNIIETLGMQENPAEGGYFAPVYTAPLLLPANYATRKQNQQLPICSSIYYLITRESFSALHRVTSDMLYHFYVGSPVEVLLLDPADRTHRCLLLGNELGVSQRPALAIPGGTWMGSRTTGGFALMGVSMAPAFDPENYEIGARERLRAEFPDAAELIAKYTRGRESR